MRVALLMNCDTLQITLKKVRTILPILKLIIPKQRFGKKKWMIKLKNNFSTDYEYKERNYTWY